MLNISSTTFDHLVVLSTTDELSEILNSLKIVRKEIKEFNKFDLKKIKPNNQTHTNLSCLASEFLCRIEDKRKVEQILKSNK